MTRRARDVPFLIILALAACDDHNIGGGQSQMGAAVRVADSEASPPPPSSRRRLDAVVHTAVEGIQQQQAEIVNRHLANLSAEADLAEGTLTIQLRVLNQRLNPFWPFLVRLFDTNGQYLTHFVTEEPRQMFGSGQLTFDGHLIDDHLRLVYPVNTRDLREAAMVEFGVLPQ